MVSLSLYFTRFSRHVCKGLWNLYMVPVISLFRLWWLISCRPWPIFSNLNVSFRMKTYTSPRNSLKRNQMGFTGIFNPLWYMHLKTLALALFVFIMAYWKTCHHSGPALSILALFTKSAVAVWCYGRAGYCLSRPRGGPVLWAGMTRCQGG